MWPRTLAHFHFFLSFLTFPFPHSYTDTQIERKRENITVRHISSEPNPWAWNRPYQPHSVVRSFTLPDTHKEKKNHSHTVSLHHFVSFPITTQFSEFSTENWTELNWNGFPRLQARDYWNSVGLRLFFLVSVSRFRSLSLFCSFACSLFFSSLSLSLFCWMAYRRMVAGNLDPERKRSGGLRTKQAGRGSCRGS